MIRHHPSLNLTLDIGIAAALEPLSRASKHFCLASILLLPFLSGCTAAIKENHYFATFNEPSPGERVPSQFFRVTVEGNSSFSNARYLTGYYDERAVSLFFNEMKGPQNGKLFLDDQRNPGTETKLTPLNAPSGEGAFVLIMSTNADSIANTIGSFAESQVVADSMTRMLNRDSYKSKVRSDAMISTQKAEATALVSRIEAEISAAGDAATGEAAAASYRRTLTALAQGLGYVGPEFGSVAEAQEWFSLESRR